MLWGGVAAKLLYRLFPRVNRSGVGLGYTWYMVIVKDYLARFRVVQNKGYCECGLRIVESVDYV